jgi:hypothetical protein
LTNQPPGVRALPSRPNLRHLKDQAKDLLKAGSARSLAAAQLQVARTYGFASWPKLRAYVDLLEEAGQLKEAIDQNDLGRVKTIMRTNPSLHQAPIGYAGDGPLTWAAECRIPPIPPGEARLEMVKWMIENGSDVHRGGDAPLMRAALNGQRIPMMELLTSHGADVNAAWHGTYPIIFAACEVLDADSLQWLLNHGADPNCGGDELWKTRGVEHPGTALDYLLGTYVRAPEILSTCIDLLLNAGGKSKYQDPAVMAVIRNRLNDLAKLLDSDPSLIHRHFPALDIGTTAARLLTLRGATLLHVAAEFGNLEAVRLLLDRGAGVNAKATVDIDGIGGQTAIFHAATQGGDCGFSIVRFLVDQGADLSVHAKLPGHYEKPGEIVECTPLGYALLFPGNHGPTSTFLRERAGNE